MVDEQNSDDVEFADFLERKPKRPRPKPKFETPEPARRRIIVDWYYLIQKIRLAINNGIHGLQRDYPAYAKAEAELDAKTCLEPLAELEKKFAGYCRGAVEDLPIAQWLVDAVKGMGWTLAAQLIGLIGDIAFFERISNLWSYAGLAPHSRRREGEKCDHNPALKRLMFNCVTSFLKGGGYYAGAYAHFKEPEEAKARRFASGLKAWLNDRRDAPAREILERLKHEEELALKAKSRGQVFSWSKYQRAIYDGIVCLGIARLPRNKQVTKQVFDEAIAAAAVKFGLTATMVRPDNTRVSVAATPALTPGHRHSRAMRKTAKLFLSHLWLTWSELDGLPTSKPWSFGPGGHDPSGYFSPPKSRDDEFPAGSRRSGEAEVA